MAYSKHVEAFYAMKADNYQTCAEHGAFVAHIEAYYDELWFNEG